jgi:hypothetical protein
VWRLIYNRYWIDNWIYWITHSYTQLQCIHFTTHYCSCNSSGIPCHRLLTLSNQTAALTLNYTRNWNCPRQSPWQLIVLVIAGERTTKKTPLRFPYCWMTSLPERTTKKTPVASIVALLSNGYKQRFYCWPIACMSQYYISASCCTRILNICMYNHHLRCNFLSSLMFICTLVLILTVPHVSADAIIRYFVF